MNFTDETFILMLGTLLIFAAILTMTISVPIIRKAKKEATFSASIICYVRGVLELSGRLCKRFGENKPLKTILRTYADEDGNAGILFIDKDAYKFNPESTHIEYIKDRKPRKVRVKNISFFKNKGNILFLSLSSGRKLNAFLRDTECLDKPPKQDQDALHIHVCDKDFWLVQGNGERKETKDGEAEDNLIKEILKDIENNQKQK